jgi:hypothetical protein
MFSLRTHVWIFVAFLAATFGIAIAGNILLGMGVGPVPARFQPAAKIGFFILFLGIGFSAIPVMVKLVLAGHQKIGNADKAPIKMLAAQQNLIICILWALAAAGLLVALPTIIADGFFDADTTGATQELGASQELLVAAPGLPVAEMLARSSLKPEGGTGTGVPYVGGGLFDLRLGETDFTLKQCRYYFITTERSDPGKIDSVSIGLLPDDLSKKALDAAEAGLRRDLAQGGWLAGHPSSESLTEQSRVWLKGGIVLHMDARRTDESVAGEDPTTAGRWIRFVDLAAKATYPGINTMVFEPAPQ